MDHPVKEFTIDRKLWYRGKGSNGSQLVLNDGTMCCLGHLGLACDIPKKQMAYAAYPSYLPESSSRLFPSWLLGGESDDRRGERLAGGINDSTEFSDTERESRITELFADHGIKVTFID